MASAAHRHLSDGSAAQCSPTSLTKTVELVYGARDGGSVLRPEPLQELLAFELSLLGWLERHGMAALDPPDNCAARGLSSPLNYVYPKPEADQLRFDQRGVSEQEAWAGVSCGPAVTDSEVFGVVGWLQSQGYQPPPHAPRRRRSAPNRTRPHGCRARLASAM